MYAILAEYHYTFHGNCETWAAHRKRQQTAAVSAEKKSAMANNAAYFPFTAHIFIQSNTSNTQSNLATTSNRQIIIQQGHTYQHTRIIIHTIGRSMRSGRAHFDVLATASQIFFPLIISNVTETYYICVYVVYVCMKCVSIYKPLLLNVSYFIICYVPLLAWLICPP